VPLFHRRNIKVSSMLIYNDMTEYNKKIHLNNLCGHCYYLVVTITTKERANSVIIVFVY
jgi:hypothetical protein